VHREVKLWKFRLESAHSYMLRFSLHSYYLYANGFVVTVVPKIIILVQAQ
jgi:hypothetical protein